MKTTMTFKIPDGSVWGVPVILIAQDRAKHYAHEFGGDVDRSLAEDTLPLFEGDTFAIQDWAVNNMDWSDFEGHRFQISPPPKPDFDEAWANGDKGFI